ncbi:hypothetical protein C8R44DRAFT_732029 [Mycena epipterygia]|nr:hypothetical protein C8R44DRAFT_732029 [Mycena epipterygia]
MPVTSRCGLDLPLDATFDYASWRKQPAEQPIPVDMDLQERKQHNHNAQMSNRISIRATRAYEDTVAAGIIPPTTTDIGKKLVPYYAYTPAELERMVGSEAFCTQVVAPIPPKLMEYILEERNKRGKAADKKREEEKAAIEKGSDLQGSMVMSNITHINTLTRPIVTTPDSLLTAIKYRMHPSLFSPEKSVLDVAKLKTLWGLDDTTEGVSILNWINTSDNFVAALVVLSAKPDNTNPFSYATEMKNHFDFIKALDDFKPLFPVWYPVDKKLRNKIIDNNLAFDANYWTSELGGALNAWKAAKAISAGSFSAPASRISDLGTIYGAFAPRPAPKHNRQQQRDDWRELPSGPRNQDNRWNSRDSFWDQKQDSFHEPRECRPLVCLICANNNIVKDHPHSKTDFIKGRSTYYSIYEGGAHKIHAAAPGAMRKIICIGYNCSGGGPSAEAITPPCPETHDVDASGTALSSSDSAIPQFLGAQLLDDNDAKLRYPDLRPYVHCHPSPDIPSTFHTELFKQVVHPYNIPEFQRLLSKHNLKGDYPHSR